MEQSAFNEAVTDYIKQLEQDAGRDASRLRLEPDANLFDLGVVTSFSMIRLIMFVEELTGATLDLSSHDPEAFYTLGGLYGMTHVASAS